MRNDPARTGGAPPSLASMPEILTFNGTAATWFPALAAGTFRSPERAGVHPPTAS